jgi:1,4-dihydroxy-2-naphthoate octaprenyltransferase
MSAIAFMRIWTKQIRTPFLLLAVLLVCIGGAQAYHGGLFDGLRFALCLLGVVLTHIAVNLFNEHADYFSGIDRHTRRTPFSGGTGCLSSAQTTPRAVLRVAIGSLSAAGLIGLALAVMAGWPVLLFMTVGFLAVIFYTPRLARWGLGEAAAGLCLGSLVVVGTFYSLTGTLSRENLLLSIPPGMLTGLLLLLNEFPDVEADRRGGRRHLVIRLGWRGAAWLYTLALAGVYVLIVAGVLLHWLKPALLLAMLTLPLSIRAAATTLRFGDRFEPMASALGINVGVVLGTDLLLALAYLL